MPYTNSRKCLNFKEKNMKKLIALCFALALLTCTVAVAQDTMNNDNMKSDMAKKTSKVTGKIGDDGKTFVSEDGKTWTIVNPDAVKGHEGHHVTLTAHVYPDKMEVHVMSLKMVK
jgi:pentapeptide MXKDX repeat protein